MNAHDLQYGIEIETIAPDSAVRRDGLRIGAYHHGIQVPYLPAGWTAENDGSINNGHGGHKCEIVSPILKGPEGLAQVADVARILETKGHTVNASCGVHVHVGWPSTFSVQALARLIIITAYLEKGLYAITGTKNREQSVYCGGVKKYGNDKAAKIHLDRERYHILNLTNLATGRKQTVEFRCFSGSTSAVKLVGWIQVCLGLVEKAVTAKRSPVWNPKPPTGGLKKAGEGQSEAERLMHYLCWAEGSAKVMGRTYGWIYDGIPREKVKAELRRLARRYDGTGTQPR
jgi:hypothetical protein